MAKNANSMSCVTVDEMIKLISDKIEAKLFHDLLTSNYFSILTDKSSDKAGRAQLIVFFRYIDSSKYETTKE